MGMDAGYKPDRLKKVLARAQSGHDGEALNALRLAQQILYDNGRTLSDLAEALHEPVTVEINSSSPTLLQDQLKRIQLENQRLVREKDELIRQVDHWREQWVQAEKATGRARVEIDHWRNIARDTAEQLWDIGQLLEQARLVNAKAPDGVRAAIQTAVETDRIKHATQVMKHIKRQMQHDDGRGADALPAAHEHDGE